MDENSSLLGSNSIRPHLGCGSTLLCDPTRWLHRYFVLIFMCLLSFGSYFCYDNPTALEDIIKSDIDINTVQYSLFYSLYSWPNVILCFFGGILLDKVFGIRLGTIIFSSIVTIGQIVFATGALLNAYWLMCLGRLIFGLGGENLAVAQNSYAVSWFDGRALNMVFGLQLSFARMGSTLNMQIMQPLYVAVQSSFKGHTALGLTLMIGACFCLLSLFCAVIMAFFDKRSQLILNRTISSESIKWKEVVDLKSFRSFGLSFWILCGICVTFYVAIFPFIGLGLLFYENKFDMTHSEASFVNSLIYIISAFCSPFFGFCIDRTGRNLMWVMLGIILTLMGHAILAFTFITPYFPVIVMGMAYSILASGLWPSVALIIPREQIGTAYGLMQSVQNLGLALVSMFAGWLVDAKGYLVLELFFLICLTVALMFSMLLYVVDKENKGMLNKSSSERKANAIVNSNEFVDVAE